MRATSLKAVSMVVSLRERIASKRLQMFLRDTVQKRKEKEAALRKEQEEKEAALRKEQEEKEAALRKEQEEKEAALRKEQEEKEASLRKEQEEKDAAVRKEKEEKEAALRKEKAAALKIVRFFRMVKKEVDREVLRCEKKRQSSVTSRRSHSRGGTSETEESLMTRVARSPIARYRNANKPARSPMARYRNASEPAVKNHDARPIVAVHVDNDDDISVLTTPSVVKRPTVPMRYATYTKRELGYDLILEEAWTDTEIHQVRNQRQIEDEYIQRHGLQEQGSLRQHPHAPYGGPSPIDPRRVQSRHASSNPMPSTVGRRTPQFAPPQFPEEFAPPQFYEGHHWPVQGD
jgi:hypothetical protein